MQARDSKRLTPEVVINIAKALNARPAPVLAHSGWISATGERANPPYFDFHL